MYTLNSLNRVFFTFFSAEDTEVSVEDPTKTETIDSKFARKCSF